MAQKRGHWYYVLLLYISVGTEGARRVRSFSAQRYDTSRTYVILSHKFHRDLLQKFPPQHCDFILRSVHYSRISDPFEA